MTDGKKNQNDANTQTIILYSTDCPRCKVLKQKLDNCKLQYAIVKSVEVMLALGITQVPALSVDGKLFSFKDAVEWANTILREVGV